MSPREITSQVLSNTPLSPGYFRISLSWDHGLLPSPGQFLLLRPLEGYDPLLPRPFTIYRISDTTIDILYQVVGQGTRILSSMTKGRAIRVIGPLGRGFMSEPRVRHAVIVAGGMGIASLCHLCIILQGSRVSFFYGAKTKASLVGLEDIEALPGVVIHLATDDGSLGYKGPVSDLLIHHISGIRPHESGIYACGPYAMLKAVASSAGKYGIPCQVSLESHMACGVGVCLGCALPCREKKGWDYRLVCADGPVFEAEKVMWK